jgi:hypothetical protein
MINPSAVLWSSEKTKSENPDGVSEQIGLPV